MTDYGSHWGRFRGITETRPGPCGLDRLILITAVKKEFDNERREIIWNAIRNTNRHWSS
jgi:hypothetical protein